MLNEKMSELEMYLLDLKVMENLVDNLVALVMNVLNGFDQQMMEPRWNLMKTVVDDVRSNLNITDGRI
jgi:hypothetical protein